MIELLAGLTIGIHLASYHTPERWRDNNINPGLYVKTQDGWLVGGYRNTLDRNSFYVAKSFDSGPFSLVLGAVSGYQKKVEHVSPRGPNGACANTDNPVPPCYITRGTTRGAIGPLVAVSYAAPDLMGVTPRLTIGFGERTAFHLSVEHKF